MGESECSWQPAPRQPASSQQLRASSARASSRSLEVHTTSSIPTDARVGGRGALLTVARARIAKCKGKLGGYRDRRRRRRRR